MENNTTNVSKNKGKEYGIRLIFFILGLVVGLVFGYYYFGILNPSGGLFGFINM